MQKTSFICSFCFRSLPVGHFYKGHWVCFWCHRLVERNPPPIEEISTLHKMSNIRQTVKIEEIDCGGKL
jgi:hypothetical protein